MPDDLKKRGSADRNKIAMHEEHEVRYWTKHLGISRDELPRAVDNVGNSGAAVTKNSENNVHTSPYSVRDLAEGRHRCVALALRGFTFWRARYRAVARH